MVLCNSNLHIYLIQISFYKCHFPFLFILYDNYMYLNL